MDLLDFRLPLAEIGVHCSKGTYIRVLAEDLAAALGTCAHLRALRRTEVEPFGAADMVSLDRLTAMCESGDADDCLLPPDAGLADWPVVTLDAPAATRFSHGNPVPASEMAPGPVRVYSAAGALLGLGEVTAERVSLLQRADHIFIEELRLTGQYDAIWQAGAILLPVRSVGVMGDQRTYQEAVALRAVTTEDFMTADWATLPHNFLAAVANRIVNEVRGINRVVYDITSKPPGTIEWE